MEIPTIEPVTFEGQRLDIDFYLKHDYESIDTANQELPAIVEWLNSNLQWFVEEKHRLKQEIKRVEAEAYISLASGKFSELYPELKKTDASITRAVALDRGVNKVHERFARVMGWVVRIQNTLLAFQTKIDLVRSNEATNRAVFPGAPPDRDGDDGQDAGGQDDSRS